MLQLAEGSFASSAYVRPILSEPVPVDTGEIPRKGFPGSKGSPPPSPVDPDVDCRLRIPAISGTISLLPLAAIFPVPSVFFVMAVIPAASMARKDAAGRGEHGDDAY